MIGLLLYKQSWLLYNDDNASKLKQTDITLIDEVKTKGYYI